MTEHTERQLPTTDDEQDLSCWNVFFTMRSHVGVMEVSNTINPVRAPSLTVLLGRLSENLPGGEMVCCTGIRVEEADGE